MTDVVAAQYEKWIYPKPIMDMEAYCRNGSTDAVAPHHMHYLYWPDGEYERRQGKIDILVAGCGANAAARYAYMHPNANVVGIDLSEASLAHERYLQKKHDLQNLTLHRMRLEEVGKLGQQFDFIDSVGVLHHLPDPVEGLTQLKAALRPNGVMGLMLYGLYGRFGVYLMQELFSRLYMEQTEGDVAVVRETLAQLSPAQRDRLMVTSDLNYDAGLVDLFLHPIDRGYTVESCLDYVESCGLVFQGWIESHSYYPEGQVSPDTTLWKLLNLLPDRERWKAMELFNGQINRHAFYVCHPERPTASYQINLDDDQFLDYVPHRRVLKINQPDFEQGIPATLERQPLPPYPLDDDKAFIFNEINGKHTIRECIQNARLPGTSEQNLEFAREFFKALWHLGYVVFKIPGAPA